MQRKRSLRSGNSNSIRTVSSRESFSNFNNMKDTLFLSGLDMITPERLLVKLSCTDTRLFWTNNGVAYSNWSIFSGAAEIFSGGPSLVGHDLLSTIYGSSRIHGVKVRAEFHNQETNKNLTCFTAPSLQSFTDNTVNTDGQQELANGPWGRQGLLQASPYGSRILTRYVSMRDMTGSDAYLFDDSYVATVGNNPGSGFNFNFGVYTNSGTLTTNLGVAVNIKITMLVEYFGRATFTNIDRDLKRFRKLGKMLEDTSSK